MNTVLQGLNILFAVAFTLSVAVQYNDPDPIQWMAIYGAALACCVGWARRRLPRPAPVGIGLVALGWAAWIYQGMHLGVPLGTALTDWGMHSEGSEDAREIGGLLLVAGWMAVISTLPGPTRRPAP